MFKLADGRERLYQWDSDVKLLIDESTGQVDEIHFSARYSNEAYSVEITRQEGKAYANIPNILLQNYYDVRVYAFCHTPDGAYTKVEEIFEITARPKPYDYVYTETELLHYHDLVERIESAVENALALAKESGEFKGDPGKDGIDGKDGYIPIKGVDYYTEADKTEIVENVLIGIKGDLDTISALVGGAE